MSNEEKDKLLFRLIAKDESLIKQLEFKLVEKGASADKRRKQLRAEIIQYLDAYQRHYYSPGYLLMALRSLSGDINRHVKTTKDKYGEIELNFLMLNESLRLFGDQIKKATSAKSRTFNNYVVQRSLKILKSLHKMDRNTQFEFREDMRKLGKQIEKQPLIMKMAPANGLDVNWLIDGELPERFKP